MIPSSFEHLSQTVKSHPNTWGVRLARLSDLSMQDYIQWTRLSREASPDTIFAAHWFTQSSLSHFDDRAETILMIAVAPGGQWLGILPLAQAETLGRIPLSHVHSVLDSNQFVGTPLVAPGQEIKFWECILNTLDGDFSKNGLAVSALPAAHRVTQALIKLCENQGRSLHTLKEKNRACWLNAEDVKEYWSHTLSPKRRSRLRGLAKQMQTVLGPVEVQSPKTAEDQEHWINTFLALEAKGWKGDSRSALLSHPQTASHFRFVMQSAFAEDAVQCVSLHAGSKILAMSCYFLTEHHAWGFKSCYDEDYARYASGVHLIHAIMSQCEGLKGLMFDSCSDPDASMINELWPARQTLVDIAVETGGVRQRKKFQAAMVSRRLWHKIKGLV